MNKAEAEAENREYESETPDLLADCRVMLRFALKEGMDLPDDLRHEIAQLDQLLGSFNLRPIATLPPQLIGAGTIQRPAAPPATAVPDPMEDSERTTAAVGTAEGPVTPAALLLPGESVLRVYEGLSRVVAPATAMTLQASEPPAGRHRFLGGMPVLVKGASWMALICAFGFVLSSVPAAKEKMDKVMVAKPSPNGSTPSPTPPNNQKPTPIPQADPVEFPKPETVN